MRRLLLVVAVVLLVAALVAYVVALVNFQSVSGETFSDIGNACMLGSILALVGRLSVSARPDPGDAEEPGPT